MSLSGNTTSTENEKVFKTSIEKEYSSEHEKYKLLFWEFETPLKWQHIIHLISFHILTIYILATFPYFEKPVIIIYAIIVGILAQFGVTGGAHRYWTHRSYKANLALRLILLFCFAAAGHCTIKGWVRDHRVHHKFSETDADPHNSSRGFFFAHLGWTMMEKHPEVIKQGQQINCDDLLKDPLVPFHDRYFTWMKIIFCFILPIVIPPLIWRESWILSTQITIARYTLVLHYTFLINSAAHKWGYKPYDKKICPSENVIVSILSNGEGYHNYHHTFPWDYRAAELGKFFNLTALLLNFFQKIGWAYDMKTASPELVKRMVEKHGDGSHYKWGHEVPEEDGKVIMKSL